MGAGVAAALLAFIPGAPYRLEQYDLPKDVVLGALGGMSALRLAATTDGSSENLLERMLAVFIGVGLVAGTLARDPSGVEWRTVGQFAATGAVFALARRTPHEAGADHLLWAALATVAVVCATVMFEAYGAVPFVSAPGRRPGAALGNRNVAARVACLALPLLWVRLAHPTRLATRLVLLAAVAGAAFCITLSRSRAAWLVSGILAILLPAVTFWVASPALRTRWRGVTAQWGVIVGLAASLAVVLPNRMGWTPSDFASSVDRITDYRTGTGRGRLIQAATTLDMIAAQPLRGVGPGHWSIEYPVYAPIGDPSVSPAAFYPGPQTPRNDILPIVAEWGVAGAALGVIILLVLFAQIGSLLRREDDQGRLRGILATGVVLAAILLGAFDSVLRVAPTAVLLALILGTTLRRDHTRRGNPPSRAAPLVGTFAALVWGGVALLSVTYAKGAARDLTAIRLISSARSAANIVRAVSAAPDNVEARALLAMFLELQGRCDLAQPHLERAAALQPHSRLFTVMRTRCAVPQATPPPPARRPSAPA